MNTVREAAFELARARIEPDGFDEALAAAEVFAGSATKVSAERGRSSRAMLANIAFQASQQADRMSQQTELPQIALGQY